MYAVSLLFKICFLAVLYTYFLYPLLLKLFAWFRKPALKTYSENDQLPEVSVLIAAHNEEKVIGDKIQSIVNGNYPLNKIEIIIGSDQSTDATNSIIQSLALQYDNIYLVPFERRSGKVHIINELVKKAKHDILIMTDANVMLNKDTIFKLVRSFKDPSTGLVDSRIENTGIRPDGISLQERSYIKAEAYVKHYEGLLWGCMMGPFGACYALRKNLYKPVPEHFLVDDFYISMQVLLSGSKCLNHLDAVVFEDVSNSAMAEFNRKIRIAAGSFQNLFRFSGVLFRFDAISFCFLSHKVLRWLGPFFILTFFISALYLLPDPFYLFIVLASLAVFIAPFLDYLFRSVMNIHLPFIRFLSHFTTTNAAQVLGLVKFLTGIRTGIWQPTQRNR